MADSDSLGDRMKSYESDGSGGRLMPRAPAIIRLDGRAFHTYTRGMERPFDKAFIERMTALTVLLVEETNACIGYTQSDEINLVLKQKDHKSEIYFNGRKDKINSVLAATASVFFNKTCNKGMPVFDCRCFSVPDEQEAINALIWRERDATRNSIQMAGQAYFSQNQLHKKNCDEIQEMLFQAGVNWNDYPANCKRGTYAQRRQSRRPFTSQEIMQLPPKHEALTNPSLMVERWDVKVLDMPIISKVANIADVVFRGALPVVVDSPKALGIRDYLTPTSADDPIGVTQIDYDKAISDAAREWEAAAEKMRWTTGDALDAAVVKTSRAKDKLLAMLDAQKNSWDPATYRPES